jgi:hypothetical protein
MIMNDKQENILKKTVAVIALTMQAAQTSETSVN